MSPGSVNGHDAARSNESIIHQHMPFHWRAVWIYGSTLQKVTTAKSMEAGQQLQKLGEFFGSGCKPGPISALTFSADLAAKYFKGILLKQNCGAASLGCCTVCVTQSRAVIP